MGYGFWILAGIGVIYGLHLLSYKVLKSRIVERERWGLNLCCGRTDGGGVNADIVIHEQVPRLVLVDVERLPFKKNAFGSVLSSHTLEHVPHPDRVYAEMARVGRRVTLVIPPLWDLWALVNVWEHRWIFLTLSKEHQTLPRYVALPLAEQVQERWGQKLRA